jgi:DNA-binding response OmpR family regulator
MEKILLIDNDVVFCENLRRRLGREGYITLSAYDGAHGLELAHEHMPNLVILEAKLPKLDGFAVCRMLRFESDIAILILTECQDEADRILGLDVGADDYVLKPFLEGELLARIRALLRRSDRPVRQAQPTIVTVDSLQLDLENRRVFRDEQELRLGQKEFDLLACLIDHHDQALSREMLLDYVWGADFKNDARTVDVHIRWLRSKIEPDPANPHYIHTIRGLGYRFTTGADRGQVNSLV